MSCGAGRRCGSDPVLLWLWRRLVATPPIRPLAWEEIGFGVQVENGGREGLGIRLGLKEETGEVNGVEDGVGMPWGWEAAVRLKRGRG